MAKSNFKWWNPGTWFTATTDSVTGAWTNIFPFGRGTKSGVDITAGKVMGISVYWACVRVLCDSAAALPLKIYKTVDGRSLAATGSEHRFRRVRRPNTYVSLREFIKFVVLNLCQSGNAFAIVARNTQGEPVQIIPVVWEMVSVNQDEDGTIWYEVTLPSGEITQVSYENMMHFKIFSKNGVVGLDPLNHLRETYGLAIVARDWASAYMRSGGWSGGYVIYKEFLNEEQQKQIRSSIPDIRRGGTEDIGKMGLLQGGPTIHNGSVSPKDSQFIESRQFEDEEISGAMGVPLWLINRMRTGSYVGNGLEQQIIAFVMFGLNPFLQIIEDEFNYKIIGDDKGEYVEFTRQALMQMDSTARAAYYKAALGGSGSSGWLSVNRVRELENEAPLDDPQYNEVSVWQFGNTGDGKQDAGDANQEGKAGAPEDIQKEALNGAQVTALQGIIMAVAGGQLSIETARALIGVAFPLVDDQEIDKMLSGDIGQGESNATN